MESAYSVLFSGKLLPGAIAVEAKQKLKKIYKLSNDEVEKWFTGKEIIIKQNTDRSTAEKYKLLLYKIGLLCEVVAPNKQGNDLKEIKSTSADETTFIEQLEQLYRKYLIDVEQKVPKLIADSKEMQGLQLYKHLAEQIQTIYNILNDLYEDLYLYRRTLSTFGAKKTKALKYDLVATHRTDSKTCQHGEHHVVAVVGSSSADISLKNLLKIGFPKKEQKGLSTIVLTEIEYMIETMKVLIEPDYVPLAYQETTKKNDNRYIPKNIKISVWQRDRGKCVECGSKEQLEYDHIIPVSKGGSNTERNVQLLCEKCNRQKSANIQ